MKLKDEIESLRLLSPLNPGIRAALDFHDKAVAALRHYNRAHRDTCDEMGNVAAPVLALLDNEVE